MGHNLLYSAILLIPIFIHTDDVTDDICIILSLYLPNYFKGAQAERNSTVEISLQFLGKNNLEIFAPMAKMLS